MLNQINQMMARALQCFQSGNHDEAELILIKVLGTQPKNFDALHILGVLKGIKNQHHEALEFFRKALRVNSNDSFLNFNIAKAFSEIGEDEKALKFHSSATRLNPNHSEGWVSYGKSLSNLKRFDESLNLFSKALALNPEYAEAWTNQGCALKELGRLQEALDSFDRSLKINPNIAETWSNRGITLFELKLVEEALASYVMAIEIKPNYAEAWNNRGIALNDLKRHEEAMACYERSREVEPNYAEAIYNKGLLQLAQKEFFGGFENYLMRWETKNFSGQPLINTGLPLCNRAMSKENILLWAEQGIGDEIFFAGMLTQALDRFSNIKLVADTRLHPILSRSFPMVTLLKRGQHLKPEYFHKMDYQAPIGDLGHILRLDSDQIMSTRMPFFVADKAKSSNFELLEPFSSGKIICGLAWRSQNERLGQEKNICLEQLEPILMNTQFEFINLQYGEVEPDIRKVRSRFGVKIHQIEGLDVYNDIDGLLALIDACDIVVTTSNLTAHLAGSIGKRGCVFVPFSKGKIWYWHLDDADSLWYPSLKVFHQGVRHDWTDTIHQAKTWIERDVSWKQ